MSKRKIINAIKNIKKAIEFHLDKIENDIKIGNLELGFYHFKEFKRSFFPLLLKESQKIGEEEQAQTLIKSYEERLEKVLKQYGCLEDFQKKFNDKFV